MKYGFLRTTGRHDDCGRGPFATIDDGLSDEDRFRLLVGAVTDYAIYMLDAGGHAVSWNAGAEHFKGYTVPEIIGRHCSLFYTPEDVVAGTPARVRNRTVRGSLSH